MSPSVLLPERAHIPKKAQPLPRARSTHFASIRVQQDVRDVLKRALCSRGTRADCPAARPCPAMSADNVVSTRLPSSPPSLIVYVHMPSKLHVHL
eukprot:1960099-Pleurochrysis_carterae.AAC.2